MVYSTMDNLEDYYNLQFIQSHSTGSIYEPMTPLVKAAHFQRIAMLEALPIGSLEGKTVVDFGTGSWGFACIFPRLHYCGFAIGIDISKEAVRISEAVSAGGKFAYGSRYKYYTSDGISIPLANSSVDLFFTGECIEHVENTDAFLDEIYRILTPDGILILTTPNLEPIVYRSFGDSYAVGPEHIALMTLNELTDYINPRFDIDIIKGYNSSIHTSLDVEVKDVEFARLWAAAHEDYPQDACGFIMLARKKDGWQPRQYSRSVFFPNNPQLIKLGEWKEVILHENLKGVLGKLGSVLTLNFEGSEIIVLFWIHDWSGFVDVIVDDVTRKIDLFSSTGGFKRVIFKNLSNNFHSLTISPSGEKNQRALDKQIIFFSASVYVD